MKRKINIIYLAALSGAVCCGGVRAQDSARPLPNIVILMADDAGYSDFSCYGSEHIKTPHIDRLAGEGMRCTDFYAAAPNCSPSRTGLMTGRFPSRVGIYSYIDPGSPMHLTRDEMTLASVLKPLGYQTCVTGKWHLSEELEDKAFPSPADHGFDYWFCVHNNAKPSHKDPKNFVRNGTPVGKLEGYSCQIVVDEALKWLKGRDKDKPFFLYIPFNEPHERIASPPELIAKHTGTAKEKKYYANIENMDNAVGRVLAYLRESGLENSTLVLFTSDNGPKPPGSAAPLRGIKSDIWDGGIRVPGILRWPGHIKPGMVCTEPLGVVDVLPTVCEMTGAPLPAKRVIDGTSMLPVFKGEQLQRKTPLFWFFYRMAPAAAMREGDWMLIGYLEKPGYKFAHSLQAQDLPYIYTSKFERVELYNLREDIGQQHDVSKMNPERVERMKAAMNALHQNMLSEKPAWKF